MYDDATPILQFFGPIFFFGEAPKNLGHGGVYKLKNTSHHVAKFHVEAETARRSRGEKKDKKHKINIYRSGRPNKCRFYIPVQTAIHACLFYSRH